MTVDPSLVAPRPSRGFALANGGRAFRHRNYRLFFGGQLVSLVGTWMQQVAQAWLVLDLTSDPFILGLTTALAFLPVLILGLFGGLIADALPKRPTLIATQSVQMMLAFILFGLTITDTVQVWHILVLATVLGITNAVDMPTRQAFTVEMVGRDDVPNAIALNSAIFNGARIVGPAIAGLTIGLFGGNVSPAFLINGLSFLAVILAYLAMRQEDLHHTGSYTRPRSLGEVRSTLADGLRYVRHNDMVLLATVSVGVVSTFGMNFGVIIPALARVVLQSDATGYGFLMTATGIGSLVAALGIAFSGRSRPVIIPLGAIVLGLALLATSVVHGFAIAMLTMTFVGFGAIAMAATANTTVQLAVPDELRGRVISVYTTVFVGSTPLGGLLMGWIASSIGVDAAIALGGAGSLVAGLGILVWLRRIQARRGVGLTATAAAPRHKAVPAPIAPAPAGAVPVPELVSRQGQG
ncbi:MAG TPA: MFS transporter [Candidatus Limnocylindrales bacterium]|nr:MFS transporter [Candidatus Limnocylindrales bacterium]